MTETAQSAADAPKAFDPKSDRFMDDPWPFYRAMRREAPVYQDPKSGIFFVAAYALVDEVMKQPKLFTSAVDRAGMRQGGLPEKVLEIKAQGWDPALTMSHNDTASHPMYRGLVSPFFTPRKLKAIEPFIVNHTAELIETMRAKVTVDFLSDFAVPLPIAVIARYLGLEDYGVETLKNWSDAFADEIGFMTSDARAIEVAELCFECHQSMIETCNARREDPRDDIISHLATARIEDDRLLNESELLSILTQLLVAGNETTTNTLAGGMRRLATDSTLVAELKAEPKKLADFVEETLRLESPVQGQFRKATEDTVLAYVAIPKDSLLHVRFASANRDEKIYGDNAEAMTLGARQPKPHVAFGAGMHFCVGAMLSRLELRIAFEQLVGAFESITLAVPEEELHYHTHFHLRGLKSLPITVR
ncbi:MAG: cytochrome P450 [Alphaproteobacteria bacterium]